MKNRARQGMTLLELLLALAIASLLGAMVIPWFLAFQQQSLIEVSRTDLHERAGRLLRFLSNDLRMTAFQTGPRPRQADGTSLQLVHDSLAGDPVEILDRAMLPVNGGADADDQLTIVRAVSFLPPLRLWLAAEQGSQELVLDRRPNRPPASSREFMPAPEVISHVQLANQTPCYAVTVAGQSTFLDQGLRQPAPVGTELLGVRAFRYYLDPHSGTARLRRDDFTSREILDDAVDGLQFEYLLRNGALVNQPASGTAVCGVKVSLLVRDLRADPDYRDTQSYLLADRTYGPFQDHYRRVHVSAVVEVRNHACQ